LKLRRKRRLGRATLETAALTLGEATPDSKALVMGERILKTFLANFAGETDALCFTCGAALFREEGFWICLRAERALLPGEFNILSAC
jgi:hypothetical protein